MVQFALGLFDRVPEQGVQEFLEPPRTAEPALRVRVPQVLERLGLSAGQVTGVLQYCVLDAAHAPDGLVVTVAVRPVPQTLPDLVERVAHPGDDVEPVEHALGVRAPLAHA